MDDQSLAKSSDDTLAETVGSNIADQDQAHPLFAQAPMSGAFQKLRRKLIRQVRDTLTTYAMVRPGARWLVGVSGGKDSHTLLALMLDLKWRGLLPVEILACNLDQVQPDFPADVLPDHFNRFDIRHKIVRRDTYSIVTEKIPIGKTYCSLCSRLRRGHLYTIARESSCEALVLGHHSDDALETLIMNMLHGGRMASMPPKLMNDAGDVLVLRPMITCSEQDIGRFAKAMKFPIIPCDLCGSQDDLERARIKNILQQWEQDRPGTKRNMARALRHIRPSHMHDCNVFDFAGLKPGLASRS